MKVVGSHGSLYITPGVLVDTTDSDTNQSLLFLNLRLDGPSDRAILRFFLRFFQKFQSFHVT